ncbi:MAG: polysaccharide biosynthesis tyrosine autokinase [Phycisphaerales bacterium]|nr:polysaccharide biosynthesis tyrosine autokinase [Phycisphaerales bacterium]MCB9856674.1 polysaccharide biosynthesis tyrosine autokinase [Phycisphaerales bacterium]MCB9862199.1 polysaccharide biosynthesis tyrosine autokinase [Phycisphaerales bacterium]
MTTLTAATPTFGEGMALAGPPSASAQMPAGFTPADLWRVLRQRMLFIILIGSFFSAIGISGVLYWYIKHPGYSAAALIKVTSLNMRDPTAQTYEEHIDAQAIQREIQNQVLMVTGSSVMENALLNPGLRDTTWYREADAEAKRKNENVRDLLADIVSVSAIRDSNIIRVSATWRIPAEVPKIVNIVVKEYLDVVNKRSSSEIQIQMQEMSKEFEIAQRALDAKSKEIQDYIQNSQYGSLGGQIDMKVAELTAHVTDLELMVDQLRSVWEEQKSLTPDQVPIDQQMQELLKLDPQIQRLEYQLQESRRNLDLVGERFMENHAMYKSAKAGYDTAFQNLESAKAQRIVDLQRRRLEESKRNYTRASEMLVQAKDKLSRAMSQQRDKDNKLAILDGLLNEQKLLTNQFQLLQEKKNRLEIQLRQDKKVRIDAVDNAVIPKRISSPNLTMYLPASVLFGYGLSIALAFLLDVTDKSVRTPRDVSRTQLPVLGTIPSTDDDEVVFERVETACLDAPHSIVAEAFRSLRANLFFSAPAEQQGVILVTSPSGDNGKTTVATNLAISIALSGRRVLLVDANFRRAALPAIFPNMKQEGLSNILIGQGQLRDYVAPSHVPGLDVLGAGPIPPNPAELLGSSYLRDVIVDARARYDQVIFDGPPVLLVSDAMVLAGAVDGCLLICEYRKTSRGALQRSRSNLEAINARIFGAVLNKVEGRRGGYFRKSYREFYAYQEPDEDAIARPKLDIAAVAGATTAADEAEHYAPDSYESDRGSDDYPHGGSPANAGIDAADTDEVVEGLDELEDEPPLAATEAPETTAAAPMPRVPTMKPPVPSPEVPEVDLGSDLDLGNLPDLSDLDKLDIRGDLDIETPPAPQARRSGESPIDTGRSDEEALDLENLADELEELEGDDFRIDDRYDLGDDALEDDEPDDRP